MIKKSEWKTKRKLEKSRFYTKNISHGSIRTLDGLGKSIF